MIKVSLHNHYIHTSNFDWSWYWPLDLFIIWWRFVPTQMGRTFYAADPLRLLHTCQWPPNPSDGKHDFVKVDDNDGNEPQRWSFLFIPVLYFPFFSFLYYTPSLTHTQPQRWASLFLTGTHTNTKGDPPLIAQLFQKPTPHPTLTQKGGLSSTS